MKKMAALLFALVILCCGGAFALNGADYPQWDGSARSDALYGGFGDQSLLLEFDSSTEYSKMDAGIVQACFFAFDAAEQNYLELYLLLPENLAAGDVLSATSGATSSISLYEVSKTTEELYFASRISGYAYPNGCDFEIRIDSVQKTGESLAVSGSLSATLIKVLEDVPTQETFVLSGVEFSFTMPLGASNPPRASQPPQAPQLPKASASPQPSSQPDQQPQLPPPTAAPQPTLDPHPAFTLPPHYAVL